MRSYQSIILALLCLAGYTCNNPANNSVDGRDSVGTDYYNDTSNYNDSTNIPNSSNTYPNSPMKDSSDQQPY